MTKNLNVTDLVKNLRAMIGDLQYDEEPHILANDDTLIRFLKSRNWDLQATEKMLRKNIAWRKEIQPNLLQCHYCRTNPGAHTLRQIGFDEAQRPVLYASFFPAYPSQRNTTAEVLSHLIYAIENAVRSMPPHVSQWVFIIDCAGMTATGCHPRLGYECAQVMSNFYPERLGLAICIKPGSVFKVAWKAMKQFLPPTTSRKVCIVNSKTQLQSTIDMHFSTEMSNWIMAEYWSNRKSPSKSRYRPFWKSSPDNSTEAHDPRGEKTYVEQYIEMKHSSGHLPHPNMIDYLTGKLPSSFTLSSGADNGDYSEDEDSTELDEVEALHLLASLPGELQIPLDAERLS